MAIPNNVIISHIDKILMNVRFVKNSLFGPKFGKCLSMVIPKNDLYILTHFSRKLQEPLTLTLTLTLTRGGQSS